MTPSDPTPQHEYTPGGEFQFRAGGDVAPPHIVYIDRDEQDRRRTTFVAEVYQNAVAHGAALAALPTTPTPTTEDECSPFYERGWKAGYAAALDGPTPSLRDGLATRLHLNSCNTEHAIAVHHAEADRILSHIGAPHE